MRITIKLIIEMLIEIIKHTEKLNMYLIITPPTCLGYPLRGKSLCKRVTRFNAQHLQMVKWGRWQFQGQAMTARETISK